MPARVRRTDRRYTLRGAMAAFLDLVIATAVLSALVFPTLYLRKRLPWLIARPQIAAGIVIGAAVLGLMLVVLIVRAETAHARKADGVFDRLCATPAAGSAGAQAFYELACSADSRVADLRGANE